MIVVTVSVLGSQNFGSTGRFLLVAFPVFAAAGTILAAIPYRWMRPTILTLSAIGLIGATAVYGAGLLT